jgi:hypothetical protein
MKKRRGGRTALALVRKYYPKVKKVVDSNKGITVEVSSKDEKYSLPGNPARCALARACRRLKKADGAIIGLTYSYLIQGTKATRFKTSEGVSREIVSFDRHKDFAQGSYRLSPVSKANRLGVYKGRSTHTGAGTSKPQFILHHTVRVREV